jgi:adenylate kinase
MRVVALVGLPGAGKSTLAKKVAAEVGLRHLQASDLIKAELTAAAATDVSSEELRLGSVVDNQCLLVSGFARATSDQPRLVLFDGHTLIDGADGLIEIPGEVSAAIKACHIVFLKVDPNDLACQRRNDIGRSRPARSVEELTFQQELAITVAKRISDDIGVPFSAIRPTEHQLLCAILRKQPAKLP